MLTVQCSRAIVTVLYSSASTLKARVIQIKMCTVFALRRWVCRNSYMTYESADFVFPIPKLTYYLIHLIFLNSIASHRIRLDSSIVFGVG